MSKDKITNWFYGHTVAKLIKKKLEETIPRDPKPFDAIEWAAIIACIFYMFVAIIIKGTQSIFDILFSLVGCLIVGAIHEARIRWGEDVEQKK